MTDSIQVEIDELTAAIKRYQAVGRLTLDETMKKQGGKFAFNLMLGLRKLTPAKGSITSERLDALRHGGGIRVRKSVRDSIVKKYAGADKSKGRGRNLSLWQLMVKRELSTREQGRGFLSLSARYPKVLTQLDAARSKFGPELSQERITTTGADSSLAFSWDESRGKLEGEAASALQKARASAVVAAALRDSAADILLYVDRKVREKLDGSKLTAA